MRMMEAVAKKPSEYSRTDEFLDSLWNGEKYKRYNGLPLRYAGGKSLAVGYVIENLPLELTEIVSPFFGGGSIEIACAKELGMEVYGYDVFSVLTNYWQVQLSNSTKLANAIEKWRPTKTDYDCVKERLKKHWKGEEKISSKIELAAHYWFNHNLSYGPGFLGWMSKIYEDKSRFDRLVRKVRDFSCPHISVNHESFETVIPKHNKCFLYCDPPYYLEDGKMFRGIYPQRNFPVHHNNFDHLMLNKLLKEHKGGFILSYNDCKTIRELYSGCKIVDVSWQYTMGQGETRIGKNRIEADATHVKKSHEILIIHYG